jgi:hypothetical protein
MTATNGLPENDAMKRLESAWARRREIAEFTKDYSLFALRSLIVLNGGAILATLAFIGNLYGRAEHPALKIVDLNRPLIIFAFGLVATVVAAVFGFLNFFYSQRYYGSGALTAEKLGKGSSEMRAATYASVIFVVIALGSFLLGIFNVAAVLAHA